MKASDINVRSKEGQFLVAAVSMIQENIPEMKDKTGDEILELLGVIVGALRSDSRG